VVAERQENVAGIRHAVKGTLTNQLLNVVGKRDGPDVHLKVWAFSATG
jgi:hypothetical protein